MPQIFRYFALVGVAINLVSWAIVARRAQWSGASEARIARAQEIIRAFFGGGALWFILLEVLQLAGGSSTPLFFIQMPPRSWTVVVAWVSIYAFWGLLLRGIWGTDAIEVMLELKLMQNPLGLEARPLRLFYSALIVMGAVVFPLIAFSLPDLPGVR